MAGDASNPRTGQLQPYQRLSAERRLLKGSLPVVIFYLAEVAMSLTDTVFVGRLGNAQLAAVGLSMGSLFPLLFGGISLVSTGGIFISAAYARGNTAQVRTSIHLSIWACLALSPILIGAAFLLPSLFRFTGQDTEVVAFTAQYLSVVAWCIPAVLCFNVYRAYVTAMHVNKIIVLVCGGAVVLNVLLNYALVFGILGLPGFGLPGSAVATTVSTWAMVLAIAAYCRKRFNYTFSFCSIRTFEPRTAREFARIGAPAFVIGIFESSLFGIVTILAGRFGVDFLAATTIAIYVSDLFIVMALGVGDLLTIEVAAAVASGRLRQGRRLTLAGLVIVTAMTAPLAAFCAWFPDLIVLVFLDTKEADATAVVEISRTLLSVLAWFLLADAAQVVISRSLKGFRDTLIPMWIAALGYWIVGLGGGWLLATWAGFGGLGLWYGLAAGLTLAAFAMTARLGVVCRVG